MPAKKYITVGGETRTISEWARLANISPATIHHRLSRGWPVEDAVTKGKQGPYVRYGGNNPNFKHGAATGGVTKEYQIWADMKRRCFNPNHPRYDLYGGRGITVCKEWKESFEAWHDYIGPRPTRKHSQDRIDNDGNYEPGNVRWATERQQQRNKRTSRLITFKGKTKTLAEWSIQIGCPVSSLHWRLSNGWSVERSLTKKFRGSK